MELTISSATPFTERLMARRRSLALAVTLTVALTGQCLAYTLELDQPGGVYPEGKVVTLTVKADDKSSLADLDYVMVMANNRTPLDITVTQLTPDWQGQFTPPAPGWYVFKAYRRNTTTREKPATVGILVAPERIRSARPEPTNFNEFWKEKRDAVTAVPLKPELTPLTDEQKEREYTSDSGKVPALEEKATRLESEGVERWNLEIEMMSPVRPVRGYLTRPTNAEIKTSPVIILLHAAGIGQFWCRGNSIEAMALSQKYNAIVLDLSAHGIMNGGSSEYYDELEPKLNAQYKMPKHWESSQLAGMALRLIRAIEFATTLPEWNGKHIVCIGESQGGGQALMAAGLDTRVSGVIALVPAMCDFAGPLLGRPSGYPKPISFDTLENRPDAVEPALRDALYCDNIYLSTRSRAKTLIFAGLTDPTCPSPGIAAAFNNIPVEKKILFFPHKKHNDFPAEDLWIGKFDDLRDGFLLEHFSE